MVTTYFLGATVLLLAADRSTGMTICMCPGDDYQICSSCSLRSCCRSNRTQLWERGTIAKWTPPSWNVRTLPSWLVSTTPKWNYDKIQELLKQNKIFIDSLRASKTQKPFTESYVGSNTTYRSPMKEEKDTLGITVAVSLGVFGFIIISVSIGLYVKNKRSYTAVVYRPQSQDRNQSQNQHQSQSCPPNRGFLLVICRSTFARVPTVPDMDTPVSDLEASQDIVQTGINVYDQESVTAVTLPPYTPDPSPYSPPDYTHVAPSDPLPSCTPVLPSDPPPPYS